MILQSEMRCNEQLLYTERVNRNWATWMLLMGPTKGMPLHKTYVTDSTRGFQCKPEDKAGYN